MADKTLDQLKAEGAQLAKNKAQLGEINSATEHRHTIQGHIVDSQKEQLSTLQKIKQDYSSYHSELSDSVGLAQAQLDKLNDQEGVSTNLIANAQEEVRLAKEKLDYAEKNKDVSEETLNNLGEELNTRIRINGAMDEAEAKADASLDSMTNKLTMLTNVSGQWGDMDLSIAGMANGLGTLGQAATKLFTTTNILMSGLTQMGMKLFQMGMDLNAAREGFAGATGEGDEYHGMIGDSMGTFTKYGLSAEHASQSIQALRNNMGNFAANDQFQGRTMETMAILQKLGVSADTAAKSIANSEDIMGMSRNEALGFQGDLGALADSLDMDINEVMGNFNQHMSTFAAEGANAGKEFMRLQAQAKKLNMSMDTLIGTMEQYDTISGAAAASAKLNAALGGSFINANDMMGKSISQRVDTVKQALKASGKEWHSMSRLEKKYLANAMGMQDVSEAAKFFTKDITGVASEAENTSGSLEDLAKKTEPAMTLWQKFSTILAPFTPILEKVADILHWIADGVMMTHKWLSSWMPGWTASLIVLGLMLGGFKIMGFLLGTLTLLKTGLLGSTIANAAATLQEAIANKIGTKAVKDKTKATKSSIGSMLAAGFAMLMIAAGIAIVVYSLVLLAREMRQMSGKEMIGFIAAIVLVGVGLKFLIPALAGSAAAASAAAPPLMGVGLAIALMGAGIWMAAAGMYMLIGAIVPLLKDIGNFVIFVAAFAALAVAMYAAGAGGFIAMAGLIAMSVGLMALGFSLFFVSGSKLRSLGMMMQGLGKVAEFAGGGMGDAVPKVKSLMDTLKDMSGIIRLYKLESALYGMGRGFRNMGVGAKVAATNMPLMVKPLGAIAEHSQSWANSLERLNPFLIVFTTLMWSLAGAMSAISDNWFAMLLTLQLAWGLGDALSNIPSEKAEKFQKTVEVLEESVPMLNAITPASIDRVDRLVDAAHDYRHATASWWFRDEISTGFVDALKAVAGNGGGGGGGGGGSTGNAGTTVILELNEVELGRTVSKVLSKRNRVQQKT